MSRRGFGSDLYHLMLVASWSRLLTGFLLAAVAANGLFAVAYLLDGGVENARPGSFADVFFFSVQTMATIGYGKMVPQSFTANVLMSIEALGGLLGFAVVTGIVFAKFSRPTARVLFSRMAVITRRDGISSLMVRMANERGNAIVEAQVHVVLARNETTAEGEEVRRFYDLDLARRQSALFALTWTAIHPITAASPFHGATATALAAAETELIVSLIGFDETFSQTIHARYTYAAGNLIWDARFADVLFRRPDGRRYVDYAHFHEVVPTGVEVGSRG